MKICEIFAGIQGESTYAGLPCVFLRMSGCNLRCLYCDTVYAYHEGTEMSGDDVVAALIGYGINLVEVTGGEPLLQKDETLGLINRLHDKGCKVLLETNGSISIGEVDKRTVIIMDFKTPKSGMLGAMDPDNLGLLRADDELKFVISDREDYEWVRVFMADHDLVDSCKILLSPVFGVLSPRDLSRWIIEDRLPVRLNLQIHKYIYGSWERGV
ncbi:MAG: radical SAM protein [Dissulfurispiraceae bacterium]